MFPRTLACIGLAASLTLSQQPAPTPPPPGFSQPAGQPQAPLLQPPTAVQQPPEVAPQDVPITFHSKVNLVMVPVVVRNSKSGKPVANLEKQDFLLFDKGKPQTIVKFSVEKAGAHPVAPAPELERSAEEKAAEPNAPSIVVADHFVAYFFDDIHMNISDLMLARNAAEKHLSTALGPADRAAIYTTSGQTAVDFTDDKDKLRDGLLQLRPRPIARSQVAGCPDVTFYMADLIQNKNDPTALAAAVQDALQCANLQGPPPDIQSATSLARSQSFQALSAGEQETRVAMLTLKDLVRRMSVMPGSRTIVMISPGFYQLTDQLQEQTDVIDRAIRANVTISALDARGLYTDSADISRQSSGSPFVDRMRQQYQRESMRADSDILAELADGTGGTLYQNNNDLQHGLGDLATTPEVYYVLGFSPQNLKLDGSYHSLKVTLKAPAGMSTKARRGYYAPRHLSSADDDAKEEISQALFSRDEMHDIPLEIHTQFFKASAMDARLMVVSRFDVRKLRYRKVDGRNGDELLLVAGLFDRNGNFVQSVSKKVTMRLKDETLAGKLNSGVSVRSDFKVAPGTYVIRMVLRDAEGQMMAAQNGAVEIP
jgi:VWFA-related protein